MKKVKYKILLLLAIVCGIIGFQTKVEAKSYEIESIDIQGSINEDGSLSVTETLTYDFHGDYNGIYITIPYNLKEQEVIQNNKINDTLYNPSNVKIESVSHLNGTEKIVYQKQKNHNQNSKVFSITDENNLKKIKVYSPISNSKRVFEIEYTLDNLCVKHNDIGELYYNFIGGDWDVDIQKLNIDIYLFNNTGELNIWGHGPYQGSSKIIDNNHVNFKVENIKKGQYVAARVIFDIANISKSTKLSNIDAKNIIFNDENEIIENRLEKNAFTKKVLIFAICLIIYWLVLLFEFERDQKHILSQVNEEELFEKYNPMIAGCIQGSREILARDILAVILNLIDKKYLNLEIKNVIHKRETYNYIVSKNKGIEEKMDSIEKFICQWLFKGKDTVELTNRLENMPKEENANEKFKQLNRKVQLELSRRSAMQKKMPKAIKIFNDLY